MRVGAIFVSWMGFIGMTFAVQNQFLHETGMISESHCVARMYKLNLAVDLRASLCVVHARFHSRTKISCNSLIIITQTLWAL